MRIVAIRGENLASLKERFEVNFDTTPLRDTSLFAIHGPTGSGKSTILDAVCLALYGTLPRYEQVLDKKEKDQSDPDKMTPQDPRRILRRGEGFCWAEVDIEAIDALQYRIRWAVHRAHKRADGELQDAQRAIYKLPTLEQEPIEGVKAFNARVQELVGLDYNQFTRTVLLAQGAFATFLKEGGRNKAELLERLTNGAIYSKISKRIYETHRDLVNHLKFIKEQIDTAKGDQTLTPERIQQLEKELAIIRKSEEEGLAHHEMLQERSRWLESIKQSLMAVDEAEGFLKVAQEQTKETSEAAAEARLRKGLDAIYPSIAKLNHTEEDIKKKQEDLATTKAKSEECQKGLQMAKDELDNKKKLLEDIERKYKQLAPKFERWNELEKLLAELGGKEQASQEALTRANETLKAAEQAYQANEREIATCNTQIAKAKEARAHYQPFAKLLDAGSQGSELVRGYFEAVANSDRYGKEAVTLRANLSKQQADLEAEKKRLEELSRLERPEVLALRNELREGQPCPVCGSIHHPKSSEKNDSKAGDSNLLAQIQKGQQKVQTLAEAVGESERSLKVCEQHLEESQQKAATTTEALQVFIQPANGIQLGAFLAPLRSYAQVESAWRTAQDQEKAANVRLEELFKNRTALQETSAKAKTNLEDTTKAHKELAAQIASLNEERNNLFGGDNATNMTQRYETKKRETIAESASAEVLVGKRETELKGLYEALEKGNKELDRLKTLRDEQLATIDEWARANPNYESRERILLLAKQGIAEADRLLANEKTAREYEAQMKGALDQARQTHAERATNHPPKAGNYPWVDFTSSRLERYSIALAERIWVVNEKNDMGVKERKAKEVEITTLRERLKSLECLEAEAKTQREKVLMWAGLKELFGSADGEALRSIAQIHTLRRLVRYANVHLQSFMPRYNLAQRGEGLVIEVIDTEAFDERRSIASLSGGETFLVSLALALALADMSAEGRTLGTLFIDEGFGALDSTSLDQALDALSRLQTQGRKVGVISHVSDFVNRIPVRITIAPRQGGSRVAVEG